MQLPTSFDATSIITFVASGIIDNVFFADHEKEKHEDLRRMYDDIHEITKKSKIPRTVGEIEHVRKRTPRKNKSASGEDSESVKMKTLVNDALSKLDEAEKSAKCGVCKKTLKEVKGRVKNETNTILKAAEKADAMRKLKKEGELPKRAKWDGLNDDQKNAVRRLVNHD